MSQSVLYSAHEIEKPIFSWVMIYFLEFLFIWVVEAIMRYDQSITNRRLLVICFPFIYSNPKLSITEEPVSSLI